MSETIIWSPGVTLEAIEKEVIIRAYKHYRNNKTATANALGISIRTLDHKLDKYKSDMEQERQRLENDRKQRADLLARARGNPGVPQFSSAETPRLTPGSPKPDAGVHMESASNSTEKQNVSLPERQKVQGMSPQPAPQGHPKKAR